MTDVEKKLNREDLYAYKNYDNKQYALIPGVNGQKRYLDNLPRKDQRLSWEEQNKRLQQFGYNRE